MRLLGAILAGGRATRFGSDKALALLGDRPLIEHAAVALEGVSEQRIVCGRDASPLGLITIPDWPVIGLGPLGGLCAALRYGAQHGFDGVVSLGCDTPHLPRSVVDRLIGGPRARFVQQVPIIGYWPTRFADELERHLARTERDLSVRRWALSIDGEALAAASDLPNINFATDLARLVANRAT